VACSKAKDHAGKVEEAAPRKRLHNIFRESTIFRCIVFTRKRGDWSDRANFRNGIDTIFPIYMYHRIRKLCDLQRNWKSV